MPCVIYFIFDILSSDVSVICTRSSSNTPMYFLDAWISKRVNALSALSYNYSFNGYLQVRFKIGIVLIEPVLSKISCLLDRD